VTQPPGPYLALKPPPVHRRPWLRILLAFGLIVAFAATVTLGIWFVTRTWPVTDPQPGASARPTVTAFGTLDLYDATVDWDGNMPCQGSGRYADVQAGAEVVISSPTGEVLATGRLNGGVGVGGGCGFSWAVVRYRSGTADIRFRWLAALSARSTSRTCGKRCTSISAYDQYSLTSWYRCGLCARQSVTGCTRSRRTA